MKKILLLLIVCSFPLLAKEQIPVFEGIKLFNLESFSEEISLEKKVEEVKKSKNKIALDLSSCHEIENYRERIFALLANSIDILFLNEKAARKLTVLSQENALRFLKNYCHVVVIKKETGGCWLASKRESFFTSSTDLPLNQTTNLDWKIFNHAFLFGYTQGYSLRKCAVLGNRAHTLAQNAN